LKSVLSQREFHQISNTDNNALLAFVEDSVVNTILCNLLLICNAIWTLYHSGGKFTNFYHTLFVNIYPPANQLTVHGFCM